MTTKQRLLLVEDEPTLRELLSASLQLAGFQVTSAETGSQALTAVRETSPDLIVLDVMLPDIDGFEVARRLRERPAGRQEHPPVLFLTARDAAEDRISGLKVGGDDYVTKPFNLEELILRIQAVLRRTSGLQREDHRLTVGDLEMDIDSHHVTRGGMPVLLSPTEFSLLRVMMENAGQVLSREQLLDQVWHYDFGGDDSIVASYVSYLRRKIDTADTKLIHTVRGTGYVLRRPRA
ncbi:response regulator transcription factor [Streptomyces sp. Je 1-332]|uniref:response regulator transcription factor n=1 Tax=Streptomyces sp. Je 1-332 TaxID=3231270 RepID=UPI00345A6492